MTAFTDYTENLLADHFWRTATFAKPTAAFYALYIAAPGEAGGGTEVSAGGYARINLAPSDANYKGTHGTTTGASSGTGGNVTNDAAITFGTPSANWGLVTHMATLDALTNGNMITYAALTQSKTINNGDPAPAFPVDAFSFTVA